MSSSSSPWPVIKLTRIVADEVVREKVPGFLEEFKSKNAQVDTEEKESRELEISIEALKKEISRATYELTLELKGTSGKYSEEDSEKIIHALWKELLNYDSGQDEDWWELADSYRAILSALELFLQSDPLNKIKFYNLIETLDVEKLQNIISIALKDHFGKRFFYPMLVEITCDRIVNVILRDETIESQPDPRPSLSDSSFRGEMDIKLLITIYNEKTQEDSHVKDREVLDLENDVYALLWEMMQGTQDKKRVRVALNNAVKALREKQRTPVIYLQEITASYTIADLCRRDPDGNIPLMYVCKEGLHPLLPHLLINTMRKQGLLKYALRTKNKHGHNFLQLLFSPTSSRAKDNRFFDYSSFCVTFMSELYANLVGERKPIRVVAPVKLSPPGSSSLATLRSLSSASSSLLEHKKIQSIIKMIDEKYALIATLANRLESLDTSIARLKQELHRDIVDRFCSSEFKYNEEETKEMVRLLWKALNFINYGVIYAGASLAGFTHPKSIFKKIITSLEECLRHYMSVRIEFCRLLQNTDLKQIHLIAGFAICPYMISADPSVSVADRSKYSNVFYFFPLFVQFVFQRTRDVILENETFTHVSPPTEFSPVVLTDVSNNISLYSTNQEAFSKWAKALSFEELSRNIYSLLWEMMGGKSESDKLRIVLNRLVKLYVANDPSYLHTLIAPFTIEDLCRTDKEGNNPLMFACKEGLACELIQLLINTMRARGLIRYALLASNHKGETFLDLLAHPLPSPTKDIFFSDAPQHYLKFFLGQLYTVLCGHPMIQPPSPLPLHIIQRMYHAREREVQVITLPTEESKDPLPSEPTPSGDTPSVPTSTASESSSSSVTGSLPRLSLMRASEPPKRSREEKDEKDEKDESDETARVKHYRQSSA